MIWYGLPCLDGKAGMKADFVGGRVAGAEITPEGLCG